MREDITLTYRCDGKDADGKPCSAQTTVWEEYGKWLAEDLAGRAVILPRDHLQSLGLPVPPSWTALYGHHFCSHHQLTVLPAEIAGEVPDLGKPEEFVSVSGLAALEKS